ncbi:hypothetical protein, partial [Candidatus Propionivibrio aalborgensis]|uniref:hypothetical protein n=1 Tax=Candidatus Propionivibrio aalborgensis TaxID=1860101 RepID=UPI001C914DC6
MMEGNHRFHPFYSRHPVTADSKSVAGHTSGIRDESPMASIRQARWFRVKSEICCKYSSIRSMTNGFS